MYLDLTLADKPSGSTDDWFSFATLSPDASDMWRRTILVNTAPDGYVRLVHVPEQGRQNMYFRLKAVMTLKGFTVSIPSGLASISILIWMIKMGMQRFGRTGFLFLMRM